MPRKITIAEAREIARGIQDDADKRRAAYAEDEARRTADVVGHCAVATGSLPVSSVQSLISRFLERAQEKEDRADNLDQEGFYGRAEEARAHAKIWECAAADLRAEMEAANVRQPEENK